MSELENLKWVVASRPEVDVQAENFELQREPVAPVGPGCMLLKARYFSVSPPARMALVSGGIARRPIPIGATMRGNGLAEVVESRNPDFAAGDLVMGDLGWQRYAISDGVRRRAVKKVEPRAGFAESTLLHVLGGGGATAYFGMIEYAKPRVGDTLVVSTAAGSVGALVCQLGRLQGCRVVGIAGGSRKCAWLIDELGCDAAHAPPGILRCQPVNQAARLQIDPHPAGLTAPALPAPVAAPDNPLPPDDGRRLNALQMRTPAGPVPRRDGPEPAVARLEPRSTSGPFPHRQLLAQNQVLEDQIPAPPAEHSQPDQKQSPIEPHRRPSARRLSGGRDSHKADRVLKPHRRADDMIKVGRE